MRSEAFHDIDKIEDVSTFLTNHMDSGRIKRLYSVSGKFPPLATYIEGKRGHGGNDINPGKLRGEYRKEMA